MTAVLLAGGKSSRMGYHPKQQLMIDGESFQTRILKQLQGFGEIAISRRNENEENAEDIPYPLWQEECSVVYSGRLMRQCFLWPVIIR